MQRQRRLKGEGSLCERTRVLPSGTIRRELIMQISLGHTPDGRRIRRWFSSKSKAELLDCVDRIRAEHAGRVPSSMRVAALLEAMLTDLSLEHPTTAIDYGRRLTRLVPILGHVRLHSLTRARIQAAYEALRDDGMSPQYLRLVHFALHVVLKVAQDAGLIDHNPARYCCPTATAAPRRVPPIKSQQSRGRRRPCLFPLISTSEAATVLQRTPQTVLAMARRRDIESWHLGERSWRFNRADLLRFVRRRDVV